MASSSSRSTISKTIAELEERLRAIQSRQNRRPASPLVAAPGGPAEEATRPPLASVPMTEAPGNSPSPLDILLPRSTLARGGLVEWLAEGDGSGAGTLALWSILRSREEGGTLVVIDARQDFFPPAAAAWGANLDELLLVRPSNRRDLLWALEQSLRCTGVSAVLCWADELDSLAFRRLQLAAEAGGGLGSLIRPARYRGHPTWADVRLLVRPLASRSESQGRRLHLELLHCRNGMSGGVVELDISDETGVVRVAPSMAPAEAEKRKAGA